jgi:hypothetical protein
MCRISNHPYLPTIIMTNNRPTTITTLLHLSIALVMLSTGSAAYVAQSGETLPAGPSEEELRWARRETRVTGFSSAAAAARPVLQATHAEEQKLRDERRKKRIECQQRLRRSNRDQLVPTVLSCVRADLTLLQGIIHQRSIALAITPGIGGDSRGIALARSDLLLDALDTVVTAIDAGAITTEEDMREARRNLRQKYVLPYHQSLPRGETEHLLARLAQVLLHVRSLLADPTLPEDTQAALAGSQTCLEELESSLEAAYSTGKPEAMAEAFGQAHSMVESCIEPISAARAQWAASQSSSQAQSSSSIGRRR